jgi:hypothetical protein
MYFMIHLLCLVGMLAQDMPHSGLGVLNSSPSAKPVGQFAIQGIDESGGSLVDIDRPNRYAGTCGIANLLTSVRQRCGNTGQFTGQNSNDVPVSSEMMGELDNPFTDGP